MKKENETAPSIDGEIKFDKRNYRRHNERNEKMISESLANYGAGRSILIDSENELIAGNGVYSQAKKLGIPTRLVETDGSELIVVKRTDLKTDDLKRKYLAVADNAISDSSFFDLELLTEDFDPMVLNTTFDFNFNIPEIKSDNLKNEPRPSPSPRRNDDDDLERGGPEHEPFTIEPQAEPEIDPETALIERITAKVSELEELIGDRSLFVLVNPSDDVRRMYDGITTSETEHSIFTIDPVAKIDNVENGDNTDTK